MSVNFSSDGKKIVAGLWDKTIRYKIFIKKNIIILLIILNPVSGN